MNGREARTITIQATGLTAYLGALLYIHWKLGQLPELSILRRRKGTA